MIRRARRDGREARGNEEREKREDEQGPTFDYISKLQEILELIYHRNNLPSIFPFRKRRSQQNQGPIFCFMCEALMTTIYFLLLWLSHLLKGSLA